MPQYVNRNRRRKRKLKSSAIVFMAVSLLAVAALIATIIVVVTPETTPSGNSDISSNNTSVDSSDISDQEAAGQIYIGGHQDYALRIGAFKVDWFGNVYVGDEIIHAAPPVVTKE